MISDKILLFSDTQDLETVLDDSVVTSDEQIDLAPMGTGSTAADWENLNTFAIGTGTELFLYVQVDEDFAGGTSVNFHLISDATEGGADDLGDQILASSGVILTAALTAGTELWIPVQPNVETDRFVRVAYEGVGTFTGGMVTAHLSYGAASALKAYGTSVEI
jgi:hypothetical protein